MPDAIAVDAGRIVADVFPDLSLRLWRTWDAAGKIPRGFKIGGSARKMWRLADLRRWADWEFPARPDFERLLHACNVGATQSPKSRQAALTADNRTFVPVYATAEGDSA